MSDAEEAHLSSLLLFNPGFYKWMVVDPDHIPASQKAFVNKIQREAVAPLLRPTPIKENMFALRLTLL